jgi:hypothetical protein
VKRKSWTAGRLQPISWQLGLKQNFLEVCRLSFKWYFLHTPCPTNVAPYILHVLIQRKYT